MRVAWLVLPVLGCAYAPGAASTTADAPIFDAGPDASDAPPGPTARRKQITILGSQVSGPLTDFPVWIELADADLASRARPDGHDIFFTDSNGSPLDHEIERWDAGAPLLLAWVRIPTLATGADTIIHVEYGDDTRAIAQSPSGVFRDGFAAVWHLEDSLANATIADSTGAHPGTAAMLGPPARVAGQLGTGVAFDGQSGSSIAFTNMLTGSMSHTITAWVSQLAVTRGASIVSVGTSGTDTARFFYGHRSGVAASGPVAVGFGGDDLFTSTDIENAGWTMLAWTFEGGTRKNHVFANGVELTPTAGTTSQNAVATTGTTGLIGLGLSGFTFAPMSGAVDEVRIATTVRTPSWLATEYKNQLAPLAFYTVGGEEVP